MHEIVVKVAINYFRQIITEHVDYVTIMNSMSTVSYLCHVPSPVKLLCLVNGQTCEFCLIFPPDSLYNLSGVFACQTCLGYCSEVDVIQVYDLKRRSFFS